MIRTRVCFSTTLLILTILTIAASPLLDPRAEVVRIRSLRLENNRAIAAHDVALMRRSWAPNIRLIASDGRVYSGSAALARS